MRFMRMHNLFLLNLFIKNNVYDVVSKSYLRSYAMTQVYMYYLRIIEPYVKPSTDWTIERLFNLVLLRACLPVCVSLRASL
jgi:hypothetical protein